jgi:hypothetical protein
MSVPGGTMADMARADRLSSRRLDAVVGRTTQVAELADVLDEVAGGRSRLVLIGGEAGAGKTTLLELFAAELSTSLANRHAQIIQGQCVALGGEGLPYAPIVGALRGLLALYGRDQILEWAGPSRAALGVLLPSTRARNRLWCWWWRTSTGPTSRPATYFASSPAP